MTTSPPTRTRATLAAHTRFLTSRLLRATARQPVFIVITLVQPLIWLLLFGQLFKRIVEIPGFDDGNYIAFLTPGVVVMTVLFSAGWTGMAFIEDMDRGVMDRMLASPVSRGAMMAASTVNQAVSTVIQSTSWSPWVSRSVPGSMVGWWVSSCSGSPRCCSRPPSARCPTRSGC